MLRSTIKSSFTGSKRKRKRVGPIQHVVSSDYITNTSIKSYSGEKQIVEHNAGDDKFKSVELIYS